MRTPARGEQPLYWVGTAKRDLLMPEAVKDGTGTALSLASLAGSAPRQSLGRGAGVLEVVEDHDRNTYRAVYTVRFRWAVYVPHCFQKKFAEGRSDAKTGGGTRGPAPETGPPRL